MMVVRVVWWNGAKQTLTTSSIIKAERMVCYQAILHPMWLKNFTSALGLYTPFHGGWNYVLIAMYYGNPYKSPKIKGKEKKKLCIMEMLEWASERSSFGVGRSREKKSSIKGLDDGFSLPLLPYFKWRNQGSFQ